MDKIKKLLKNKVFVRSVIAVVAAVVAEFGLNLDVEETVVTVTGVIALFIGKDQVTKPKKTKEEEL